MAAATPSVDAAAAVTGQAQQPARVIGAFSFLYAGFAAAAELWRGRGEADIADAAANGAAAGFLVGPVAGVAAAPYLALR
jgi:hypothetical protein